MAAGFGAAADVDDHARRVGFDGPRAIVCHLQPAGRATGRGQGRIGKLPDDDGTASFMGRHAATATNVFSGVADVAASGVSGAVSDRRDVSWRAVGRSSTSAQCFCGTGGAVYALD